MDEIVVKQANKLKNEGNKLMAEGDLNGAIANYTEAIEMHPTAVFHSNRAACYLKKKEYGQAASDGAAAITLDPNYAKGYYRRGSAFMALGNYDEAHTDFKEVATRFPKNKSVRLQLKACTDSLRKRKVVEATHFLLTFLRFYMLHSGRLLNGLAVFDAAAHARRVDGFLATLTDTKRCTVVCHEMQLLLLEMLSPPMETERENLIPSVNLGFPITADDAQPRELQFFVDGQEEALPVEADVSWTFAELRKAASDDGLKLDGAFFFVRGKTFVPAALENRKWAQYVEGESVYMRTDSVAPGPGNGGTIPPELCSADSMVVNCMADAALYGCVESSYSMLPYWFPKVVSPETGEMPRLGDAHNIEEQQFLQYASQILWGRENGWPRDSSGRGAADMVFDGVPQWLRDRSDGVDSWGGHAFDEHELVQPNGAVDGHSFFAAVREREATLALGFGRGVACGHEDIERVFRKFWGFQLGTLWCFHLQAHAGRAGGRVDASGSANWEEGAHLVNHRFTIVELLGYIYLIESACSHPGQPAAAKRVGGAVTFAEILEASSSTQSEGDSAEGEGHGEEPVEDRYCSVACLGGTAALPNFYLGYGEEGAKRAIQVVKRAGDMERFPRAEVSLSYFMRRVTTPGKSAVQV